MYYLVVMVIDQKFSCVVVVVGCFVLNVWYHLLQVLRFSYLSKVMIVN